MFEPYPKFDCRGVSVPLFPWIMNLGLDRFEHVAKAIDALPPAGAEWSKIPILVNEPSYIRFLAILASCDEAHVVSILNDFRDDRTFEVEMTNGLDEIERISAPGDLRFHAISLYVLVRALRPAWVIETGVAHGKSSSFVLAALDHNRAGRLVSIDLPPDGHLADGSQTSLSGRQPGWLVPERLRSHWDLLLGDSLAILPSALDMTMPDGPDIFLHDSLHTYNHTASELEMALGVAKSRERTVLVDNLDMGSGYAFADLCSSRRTLGVAYRDFGGARFAGVAGQ